MEAPILYLFNRASDGQWIFGKNTDCEVAAGQFRLVPSVDRTTIDVYQYKLKGCLYYRVPVTNFKDENGNSYPTFNDLKAAYLGFTQDGSSVTPLKNLIQSLNPIFWIEDITNVVDGKLVDKSGNNKQISVSTTVTENDTITMPANDTAIIDALKLGRSYEVFYTNDSTPKSVQVARVPINTSNTLFSYYNIRNFCLFGLSVEYTTREKLLYLLSISKAYSQSANIFKFLNYYDSYNTYINNTVYYPRILSDRSNKIPTITDNALSFSESKKTVTKTTLTTSVVEALYYMQLYQFMGGRYRLSFWIDRTKVADRYLTLYIDSGTTGNKAFNFSQTNLNTLNFQDTSVFYNYVGKVLAISGNWSLVSLQFDLYNSGNTASPALNNAGTIKLAYTYGTSVIGAEMALTDICLMKDSDTIPESGNVYLAPYNLLSSKINGKTLCSVGDSITSGGVYTQYMQYKYGLKTIYNCGVSGRTMVDGSTSLYQDLATVIARDANIYTILATANDFASPIGTIDSVDGTTYMGAYNNYLTYLLANLSDIGNKKIILITQPFIIGVGKTLAQGEAAYKQQFINMANAVKSLGVKYNLPVCDLHGLMPMNWTNAHLYLQDKVHWDMAFAEPVSDILGKFINDLY